MSAQDGGSRICKYCGEPMGRYVRPNKVTCGVRCRVARCRLLRSIDADMRKRKGDNTKTMGA